MPYSAALNLGTTINQSVWQFSALRTGVIAFGPSFGLLVGSYLGNSLLSVFKGHAREVLVGSAIVMSKSGHAAPTKLYPADISKSLSQGLNR